MFRGLYGRVKLVKSPFGEPGSSITLKVSSPRSVSQFIVSLPTSPLNGMTFSTRTYSPNSGKNPSKPVGDKLNNQSLIRNGLIVDSTLRNSSLSEGYYRNDDHWGQGRRRSQNTDHDSQKCEFNFDSVPIRLLEFGFITTAAVAVGIDFRTRFQDCTPRDRGTHDFCHNHHHNLTGRNESAQSAGHFPLSRALELGNKESEPRACSSNDPALTTIRYCGSCALCRNLFDKLLHLYTVAFASRPYSALSILAKSSSSLPKNNGPIDERNEDPIDDCVDGPFEPEPLVGFENNSEWQNPLSNEVPLQEKLAEEEPTKNRQRKKSVFIFEKATTSDNAESSKLTDECVAPKSASQCSDLPQTPESGFGSAKSTSEPPSPPVVAPSGFEDNEDIAAVFRLASIEYADQLNNLVAISLMNVHKPDEAMQCWSSCDSSSRAFFNMGVAYESGRHAKNAQPDLDRAHDCYALAASMGHRDAIFNLALFYLYGKGKVEANVERGIDLLEIAASKGVKVAEAFCAQLRHQQRLDEIREQLQRKPSRVDTVKGRPLRTSMIRPSASMFGSATTRLKPKHSASKDGTSMGLKRNNSAPNLHELYKSSPVAIASN